MAANLGQLVIYYDMALNEHLAQVIEVREKDSQYSVFVQDTAEVVKGISEATPEEIEAKTCHTRIKVQLPEILENGKGKMKPVQEPLSVQAQSKTK